MIQKKICMLGAFAVGKTSLVKRFVQSIFSEKYLTTIGVKIDKKIVKVGNQDVQLLLWDLQGEDEFNKVRTSYLRGAGGYFLVVDGTRRNTLDVAFELHSRVEENFGQAPFNILLNKIDLGNAWELDDNDIQQLSMRAWTVLRTSAKTGEGVQEAFISLAESMLQPPG